MRHILLTLCLGSCVLFFSTLTPAKEIKSSAQCKSQAIKQASKLLEFHFGADDRIQISDDVITLPSLANPQNPKQRFDVLEVWGYIYKGVYRMRFEYFSTPPDDCLLMGQEILEYANL